MHAGNRVVNLALSSETCMLCHYVHVHLSKTIKFFQNSQLIAMTDSIKTTQRNEHLQFLPVTRGGAVVPLEFTYSLPALRKHFRLLLFHS